MLKRLSKSNGNKYTLISIIMIILMMYFFKFAFGGTEGSYPQFVYYGERKYEFSQTVSESSFRFIRKYGMSYEGYTLLLKRGERNLKTPEKVYIYAKWGKYKEYKLDNQI
ncbi:MAG: hypothetical protein A2Y23_12330 [Clostridiales bacterium GWB2_37_7]|nr:MAG: hypothetical protein A2Y23_12330 [Clostridiales bacterium GWB2_37_7]